jgi:hypothetical protein
MNKYLKIYLENIEEGLFLEIKGKNSNSAFCRSDAFENGEAPNQIFEGHFYYYKFSKSHFYFKSSKIVDPSPFNSDEGRIAPNIYVGTLKLPIYKKNVDHKIGSIDIEVQSIKSSYRHDYRFMLEAITEKCTDLLMQANSPVSQNFDIDFTKDSNTLYQRFAFIKSIISSEEFNESVNRIVSFPSTKWVECINEIDIRNVGRINNSHVRQFFNGTNRSRIRASHPLSRKGFKSIPTKINSKGKVDTVDTPENRFIKHALETFLKLCTDIESAVKENSRIHKEVVVVIENLESHLHHTFFSEISRAQTLKLNSPVLQRKEGYREILKAWLMFDLAAKLIWHGGEDVYSGGKRDVATLYEYWLFFTLLDLLNEIFDIDPKSTEDLIQPTNDSLGLQLKQGEHTAISGIYKNGSRKLNVRFNFNRSFKSTETYPQQGSWTKTMRPDYTLTIWPYGITAHEAEKEEIIVHIHFDAKYKIENLSQILSSDEDLDTEKESEAQGKYKNADLLKMHAYKDAIRRTGGAYVLYPGNDILEKRGFHELIPGLGAFPIRPSKMDNGISELKIFIQKIVSHFLNRASQRENLAYRIFDIHKDAPNKLEELIPEAFGKNRNLIPDDTFILITYYKKENLAWIIKNGLVNVRTGSDRGSLRLGSKETGAKYLLLHTEGETITSKLFRITESGPRIFSKQTLIKKGYPSVPSQDFYLVYKIESIIENEFNDRKWDISKLNDYKKGRGAALPFSSTLTELMNSFENTSSN